MKELQAQVAKADERLAHSHLADWVAEANERLSASISGSRISAQTSQQSSRQSSRQSNRQSASQSNGLHSSQSSQQLSVQSSRQFSRQSSSQSTDPIPSLAKRIVSSRGASSANSDFEYNEKEPPVQKKESIPEIRVDNADQPYENTSSHESDSQTSNDEESEGQDQNVEIVELEKIFPKEAASSEDELPDDSHKHQEQTDDTASQEELDAEQLPPDIVPVSVPHNAAATDVETEQLPPDMIPVNSTTTKAEQ